MLAAIKAAALTYVLIGRLGLLFGALTRADSLLLVVTYVLSLMVQQVSGSLPPGSYPWLARLAAVMPPCRSWVRCGTHSSRPAACEACSEPRASRPEGALLRVLAYGLGAWVLG